MIYELKQCRTAEKELERYTTVEITEKDGELTFCFKAKNCKYYCPYSEYNKLHSEGDICEILIGSDLNRKQYYEIELSPKGDLMLAKMSYLGENEKGPILGIDFVEKPFVKVDAKISGSDYEITAKFNKNDIKTGDGEIFFNAYRIDTDGGKNLDDEQLLYALSPTMRGKFHTPNYFLLLKDYV